MLIQKRSFGAILLLALLITMGAAWAPAGATRNFDDPCPSGAHPSGECVEKGEPGYTGPPVAPRAATVSDEFGYVWDDGVAYNWKDLSTGLAVITGTVLLDDVVVGPFNLGFYFNFYEYAYSQVYISSNGLIGFEPSMTDPAATLSWNLPVPMDYEIPQNIIAPFWDDLYIGPPINGGEVYYATGVEAGRKYFAVEWHDVGQYTDAELTFETILYEDGDIIFQYQELDGTLDSATVGIEDKQGVDGLMYLYNYPALTENEAILFNRPDPSRRVKAYPAYQGALNIAGKSSFQVSIVNSGDLGQDVFNLSASPSDPDWSVILTDQSGNLVTSTTPLLKGESYLVKVNVMAPPDAVIGDYTSVQLTTTSSSAPGEWDSVRLGSAVPAPFSHTYRQGQPIYIEFIAKSFKYLSMSEQFYTASTFALENFPADHYISLWEVNSGSFFTNLEYQIFNGLGMRSFGSQHQLTANSAPDMEIRDIEPALITAPNGITGVVWVRKKTDNGANPAVSNWNVYFTRLDQNGEPVGNEVQVTDNDTWTAPDVPYISYEGVRIAATSDSQFHIAWVQRNTPGAELDIMNAVYNYTGDDPVKPATFFTDGVTSDELNYNYPSLVTYSTQMVLFYTFSDLTIPDNSVDKIVYARLENDGDVLQGQTNLFNTKSAGLDSYLLSNGNLALAWTDSNTEVVGAAIISNLSSPGVPVALANPDGRSAAVVSVTGDKAGNTILTWMDGDWNQRLYYAMADVSGDFIPPLTFKYAPADGSTIETVLALGNASYEPLYRVTLPLIVKP
jgi:hypothetical protein